MTPIREWASVTPESFHAEIVPAAKPAVFRGLAADWPVVRAGRKSQGALFDYLKRFDSGKSVRAIAGPPEIGGRFFYNDDLTGFNFKTGMTKLSAALDFLAANAGAETPPALAVQSVSVCESLPEFADENSLTLAPASVDPRIWIGNAATVAAHHDPFENIAVVAAGRRRFTLFPPEEVANLYIGPHELTPAGATISMVEFDAPDFERHPKFADAQKAARVAELEPGDAIYIPYLWWHHVRSIEAANILVNYWWAPPAHGGGAPMEAFLHALASIRNLPDANRAAWRALFEHYIFGDGTIAGAHLPDDRKGVLGPPDPEALRGLRAMLARALAQE